MASAGKRVSGGGADRSISTRTAMASRGAAVARLGGRSRRSVMRSEHYAAGRGQRNRALGRCVPVDSGAMTHWVRWAAKATIRHGDFLRTFPDLFPPTHARDPALHHVADQSRVGFFLGESFHGEHG